MLIPRLRLSQQRGDLAKRIELLLEEFAAEDPGGEATQRRDTAIFGPCRVWEEKSPPRCLAKLHKLSQRDYHPLRCYAGSVPITRQSGKKTTVVMWQGCNERLRNALYH